MGLSVEQLLGSDPDAIRKQLIAQERQALNPQGDAARSIGMLLGGGIANVTQGRGFFEPNTPGLQRVTDVNNIMKSVRFDPNNPAQYYQQVGTALQDAGYGDLAPMAFAEAQKVTPKDKFITGKAGDIIYRQTPTGELTKVASIPDKDKIPAAKEQADRIRLEELQTQFGPVEGARRFREERDAEERRRVAAGVPPSGQVKVTDLNTATQLVDRFVKGPQEKLSTARDARSQLVLARKGEGAAFAQLQRQLVKLVGDSQIGMGEVRDALGSAGIVGNTISAVNQFMTGVPSADKLDSVEQVINALEDINAQSYNSGRKRAESVLNEANLSEGTRKSLIPPPYKTGREKKTGGFVEGKVYKDAKGNRARYVNGKWEPVQ